MNNDDLQFGFEKLTVVVMLCLSPYLFSLYVDDAITALRNSGYRIFVGNIFTSCILYADDIILLICSF